MLYADGKSLAWLGDRYDVSHTTVAAALRRHGMQLRSRPGWSLASFSLRTHLRSSYPMDPIEAQKSPVVTRGVSRATVYPPSLCMIR